MPGADGNVSQSYIEGRVATLKNLLRRYHLLRF